MIKAKRIGHATFETPDLERQLDYYQHVVGLKLIGREGKRAFLASAVGQLAIVLEQGSRQRCARLAFEVAPDLDAAEIGRRLAEHGLRSEKCSDAVPGAAPLVSFTDPKDTVIELFSDWSFLDVGEPAGGVVPFKLGHVAFFTRDPQAVARFYQEVLGFRVSDWIGDYFGFLRCGIDHHTVNFLRGDTPGMQHIAFELRDAAHMQQACDLLGRKRIKILWGPVRHGPGHNIATYHRNPDQQLVEFFIDLDRMADEELEYFEPRPWHRDRPQKPKVWDPAQPRDIWGLPPTPEFLQPPG
jgi:catechol 2,3-dioxygenase-like lactoylglutathione lyase family enzyme